MKTSQTIAVERGRRLGFAEYGPPTGNPVFYFHGFPGSRLEAALVEEKLTPLNVHFIAIDRPGMGLSDYQKKRRIIDWPEDVLKLAKHLRLDSFAVMGTSGGGPYALACAYKINPKILSGCAVVSGSAPYELTKEGLSGSNKRLLFVGRKFPGIIHFSLWLQFGRKIRNREWWENNYSKFNRGLPEPDQQVMFNPQVKDQIITKSIEAFRQGAKGLAHDFKLYTQSWGFMLNEIPTEAAVLLFHGELDANVPIAMAKTMGEEIPNSRTNFYPEEGHLSVFMNKFEEILACLFDE